MGGQTPEEKGYSLRTNRLRKRPENRTLIPTLPPAILSESAIKTEEPEEEEEEELPETPKLTYQQLKERGFTGTRYDAELVSSQGLYEKFRESTMIIQPKSIVQIHQRSLRSTPDRIRKRCQVGRAASDTSSGISDDGSSSTHSGSDSGIETASLDGSGQPTILEQGVQNMCLDMEDQHQQNHPRLKLTLRMKRSTSNGSNGDSSIVEDLPNYEVFRMEGVGSTNNVVLGNEIEKFRETSTSQHEQLETGNGNNTAWRIRKRTRRRDISSCSSTSSGGSSSGNGLKRLKLILGDETMSTIDLDSSNCMT